MTSTDPAVGPPIVGADRFPVVLLNSVGAIEYPKARVVLTVPDSDGRGRLIAWRAPNDVIYDTGYLRGESIIGPRQVDWIVETDQGKVVIRSAGGCGCSDPLKHWSPPELAPYQQGRFR